MSILRTIDDATDSVLSFVLSPIRAVIRRGLRAVASWALAIFHLVGNAWLVVSTGALLLGQGLTDLAESTLHALTWLTRVALPALAHWAAAELHRLGVALGQLRADVLAGLHLVATAARAELHDALVWVERNIIDPVERRLTAAEHQLYGDVRTVADLVLHPRRLLTYLLDAALADVPGLAETVARPALGWLRRSGARDIAAFATDLERIIAAVL